MKERATPILKRKPLLLVLSGPSGAGKDAVLNKMKRSGHDLHYAVTVTTRPSRPGEKEGVDYHFVSVEKFWKMVENKELLEWAKVYENYYGVPQREVRQALEEERDVMVKVDIQGAASIKNIFSHAVLIFLTPPSSGRLITHLKQRHTETGSEFALRLDTVEQEMKSLPLFDYVVTNYPNQIDLAVAQIDAIITAEKCRSENLSAEAFADFFNEAMPPTSP